VHQFRQKRGVASLLGKKDHNMEHGCDLPEYGFLWKKGQKTQKALPIEWSRGESASEGTRGVGRMGGAGKSSPGVNAALKHTPPR